ncbi:Endonuclease/exonuclease/phosphatase family protein [Heracleum sosnowskyi]|uniref:Endonuclease/exonuclease/phosphatase family protein n=1 Tax=Heracleum sosnowskyi TaxID=360622 RepID=A0AAD8JCP4_9APIA|nr:Endonuclease/exonuclease/phosphatase family protein [Heracleum sosnowskyi]
MSVLSWNCRGVGLPWNVRFLKDVVRQEKPVFIFLCETIGRKDRVEWVRRQLGYEGMVVVEPQGRSGGLALLWKETDQGNLLSYSQNHIDIEVRMEDTAAWRLTGVYGEPVRANRKKTWDLLRHLARDSNLPWVAIGDMNNTCSHNDKKGGNPYPNSLIEGFNEALIDAGLMDMNLTGHQFTWERGRGTENWMEVRLDRALMTDTWLTMFPVATLYNLEGSESDHSPLLLVPKRNENRKAYSRFRFENAWLSEPMCLQLAYQL